MTAHVGGTSSTPQGAHENKENLGYHGPERLLKSDETRRSLRFLPLLYPREDGV